MIDPSKPMQVVSKYLSADSRSMTVADVQGEIRRDLIDQGYDADMLCDLMAEEMKKYVGDQIREATEDFIFGKPASEAAKLIQEASDPNRGSHG